MTNSKQNFIEKAWGFCQHNTNESAEKELYTKSLSLSDRVWVCLDLESSISNCLHCSIKTQNQGWRGGPALKSNCFLFQTTQIQCPAPSGMMKGRSVADMTWAFHSRAHSNWDYTSTRLGLSKFCYKR